MTSEQVLEVLMRRHVFDTERPFAAVLDGIFGGISQPDIEALFSKLAASTSYEQFSSVVRQAQGSIGAYDTVVSAIARYHDAAASEIAGQLDAEVLGLLRQVTGVPASAPA